MKSESLTQAVGYVCTLVRRPQIDHEGCRVTQQFDLLRIRQRDVQGDDRYGLEKDYVAREESAHGDIRVIIAVDVSRLRDRDTETAHHRRELAAGQPLTILPGDAVPVAVEYVHCSASFFLVRRTYGDVTVTVIIDVAQTHHSGTESASKNLARDLLHYCETLLDF